MNLNVSEVKTSSDGELSAQIDFCQSHMNVCLDEQKKRQVAKSKELDDLRVALDKVRRISSEEVSRLNGSVGDRLIDCKDASAVVSAISGSVQTPQTTPKLSSSSSMSGKKVIDIDDVSLPSNSSDVSPVPVGRDCDGRFLYHSDLVEVLRASQNDNPFKYMEKAFVDVSTGVRIKLMKATDSSVTGFRDGRYVRLVKSSPYPF